jgi:hypothetical protein
MNIDPIKPDKDYTLAHTGSAGSNSDTALYRFPYDIVEKLLLLVQAQHARDDPARYKDTSWIRVSLEWPRLMLVCRLFRESALASAKLWSTIRTDQCNPDWIKLCLERAGNHPLEIYGFISRMSDESTKRTFELIDMVQARCWRITIPMTPKAGVLDDDNEQVTDRLLSLFLYVKHLGLETLEVMNPYADYFYRSSTRITGSTFLGGNTTHLTYLLLDTYIFDTMPLMPELRRLVLRRCTVNSFCDNIRQMLSRTPALLFFRLDSPYLRPDDDADTAMNGDLTLNDHLSGDPPVVLSHLAVVELIGDLITVGRALAVVPNPNSKLVVHIEEPGDIDKCPASQPRSDLEDLLRSIMVRVNQYLSVTTTETCGAHSIVIRPLKYRYKLVRFDPDPTTMTHAVPVRTLQMRMISYPDLDLHVANLLHWNTTVRVLHPSWLVPLRSLLILSKQITRLILWNLACGPAKSLEGRDLMALQALMQADSSYDDAAYSDLLMSVFENILSSRVRHTHAEPLATLILCYGPSSIMHRRIPSLTVLRQEIEDRWKLKQWIRNIEWMKVNDNHTIEALQCIYDNE